MSPKLNKLLAGLKVLETNNTNFEYSFKEENVYQCTINELLPKNIIEKYQQITIHDIINEFNDYEVLPGELLGKRSSRVIISANRKYCCKEIDEDSSQKMLAIINELSEFREKHIESYLIEIYRIFKVESIKENMKQADIFMIMPCVTPKFEEIFNVYDIKGFVEGRALSVKDLNMFKFGKDENFLQSEELKLIEAIPIKMREEFVENCAIDAKFLCSQNIIDYSILICFRKYEKLEKMNKNKMKINEDCVMEWFVIDYFQEYNIKKKAENKIKSLFRKEVSSVNPEIYFERFVKFLVHHFIGK